MQSFKNSNNLLASKYSALIKSFLLAQIFLECGPTARFEGLLLGNTNSTSEYVGSSSKLPITSSIADGTKRFLNRGGFVGGTGEEVMVHITTKLSV
jgi:hypothetical protein